jgi:hypothetical protein
MMGRNILYITDKILPSPYHKDMIHFISSMNTDAYFHIDDIVSIDIL